MVVVTQNDITNAIILAENVAYLNGQARANILRNGGTPCKEDNDKAIEIEQWITILNRATEQLENGCTNDEDVFNLIQKVNEQYRDVDCDVSRTYSRSSSSGGGSNPPTGYVERVLGVNVDNSNPSRPEVKIYVDGITITGDGTIGNPFVAAVGGGTVVSVNSQTGIVVLTTTDIAEGTNQYFTTARVLATALTGLSVTGTSVVATDTILQAFGKLQNQINLLAGGVIYQGTWNASTNTPALASGVGTKGYYYVVAVAGTTNLDGITDWEAGDWAIYNGTAWEKVDNTDSGGGNANITQITVAALQTLQSTSAISTTTIYEVTDASPYVLRMQFDTVSQDTATATILDAVYGGTVLYTVSTNTWSNGNIFDVSGSNYINTLPTNITQGSGSALNVFIGCGANILGASCRRNTFKQGTNGWEFDDNLSEVTIETASGASGLDCTNLTNFAFLYNNAFPATITYDEATATWYHSYNDFPNDRIVTTNMTTFAVSYVGGGDMILSSVQTNTGLKIFLNGTFGLRNIADTFTSFFSSAATAARTYTLPDASTTIVGTDTTQTLTNKRITARTGTTTSSATPTINTDNVDFFSITAQTVDITNMSTNLTGTPTEGQTLWIAITGTAARAITWGASFEASTIALPTTTVTTARLDVAFIWNTVTSKWRCVGTC